MDFFEMRQLENRCIEDKAPFCQALCPLHVDARGLCGQVLRGEADAEHLRKALILSNIAATLCHQPCQAGCARKNFGGSLHLSAIERYCLSKAPMRPRLAQTGQNGKRAAVIGGETCGVAAAVTLFEKRYDVTVFAPSLSLFEMLKQSYSEHAAEIEKDEAWVLKSDIHFIWNYLFNADSLQTLKQQFDAVLLTDDIETDMPFDNAFFTTSTSGVFAVSNLARQTAIDAISSGKRAAISADRFLSRVSITASRENEGPYESQLFFGNSEIVPKPCQLKNGITHQDEEILAEAGRCLDCRCLMCVRECVYLEKYGGYPKKYIREISNNLSIVAGARTGRKFINSCSLCGLCGELCPNAVNMADVCLSAKREMVRKNNMPPHFHDFPLSDMKFANSEKAAFVSNEPGFQKSAYAFFPGCQLGAVSPKYVTSAYHFLREHLSGGVGIAAMCCGAPAKWSGHEHLELEVASKIREAWESLGRPMFVLACASCHEAFGRMLPEIPLVSLWEIYAEHLSAYIPHPSLPKTVSVHDPCTSRHLPRLQKAVRHVLEQGGVQIVELEFGKEKTRCCGYGGLVKYIDKDLAHEIGRKRLEEAPAPLVTYCVMCKCYYASCGGEAYHLLDYLSGSPPSVSEDGMTDFNRQRTNRIQLKEALIQLLNHKNGKIPEFPWERIELEIDEPVYISILERMITLDDIKRTIHFAETSGYRFENPKTHSTFAHYRPRIITYWVEYQKREQTYRVLSAYSHRVFIREGVIEQMMADANEQDFLWNEGDAHGHER